MKLLSCRERESVNIGKGHNDLTESEAAAFARVEPLLPAGALRWEHRKLRFGPFCGVLRAGNVVVELLPKVDRTDESAKEAQGLLVKMLRIGGVLNVAAAGRAAVRQQGEHLLDVFILDFCSRVNETLRSGAIVNYREHAENLRALRGRLRLTDHLRENAFDHSRLFCAFDERTIDNSHNRLLKSVLARLLPLTISAHARGSVVALLHRFDAVSSVRARPDDIEKLPFDRMTSRWKPVFMQAKRLLERLFPDVRAGEFDDICLLFNMEKLFEAFVGAKLRKAWRTPLADQYRVYLQGPRLSLASSDSNRNAFTLRPDIVIRSGSQTIRVFDVKWKKLNARLPNLGVSTSDVYQLASYASRYQCKHVALIYPASEDCSPSLVGRFTLNIPQAPVLEVHAIDVRELAFGGAVSAGLSPAALGPGEGGRAGEAMDNWREWRA